MFLVERAISLACFLLVMLLTCWLLSRVKGNQYKIILMIYLFFLGLFAWNYEPYITADLYRLREYVQVWTSDSWQTMLDYAFNRADICWVIYSWIVSQWDNENFLQTVACLWGMGLILWVISDLINKFEIKGTNRGLLLFYFMATGEIFLGIISGIRSVLGTCIIFYCIYNEYFEGKSVIHNIPFYLVAMGFHSFCILVAFIRLAFLAIQGKSGVIRIINIIIMMSILTLGLYFGQFYLNAAMEKSTGYVGNANEYVYWWSGILALLWIGLNIFLIRWYFHYREFYQYKYTSYVLLTFGVSSISLISLLFSFAIFFRLALFASLLSLPLISLILGEKVQKLGNGYRARFYLKNFMLFMCLLAFTRGNICGYKFFILS